MGKATQKTKVKNNAGGSAKVDEVLSFQKDQDTVSMKVAPAHRRLRCAGGVPLWLADARGNNRW